MSFNSAGSLAAGAADSPLLVTTTQLQIPALKVKTSGAHTEPGANKRYFSSNRAGMKVVLRQRKCWPLHSLEVSNTHNCDNQKYPVVLGMVVQTKPFQHLRVKGR